MTKKFHRQNKIHCQQAAAIYFDFFPKRETVKIPDL